MANTLAKAQEFTNREVDECVNELGETALANETRTKLKLVPSMKPKNTPMSKDEQESLEQLFLDALA